MAPCVGALLGTLIYELMVEVHHPSEQSRSQASCPEGRSDKMGVELEGVEADREKPT